MIYDMRKKLAQFTYDFDNSLCKADSIDDLLTLKLMLADESNVINRTLYRLKKMLLSVESARWNLTMYGESAEIPDNHEVFRHLIDLQDKLVAQVDGLAHIKKSALKAIFIVGGDKAITMRYREEDDDFEKLTIRGE